MAPTFGRLGVAADNPSSPCKALHEPAKQAQLNRSVWDENSGVPSSSFMGSMQTRPNAGDHHFSNSDASFGYSAEVTASVNSESLVEGWDIVEHPQSQVEDV
ncbi:hypothetical protein MUK42_35055 [Musa troglodytarum]|uniref:Uncharacterized protein n=1 Tax=Musa troglodytarum TaxID=320322 RepID=A0A9E7EDE3_9LILI|nr:hypothetical protein MUK42_35055 [Musa troglodytarum]